jgi:phage gp29-like protein
MAQNGIYISPNKFISFAELDSMPKDQLFKEIGTRDNSFQYFSNMFGYLPNPDPVLKKTGQDIAVYRDLYSDAKISSVVAQRKSGVESMDWEISRGKSKSREAKKIEDCFKNLHIRQCISEMLDAPAYGFAIMEAVWDPKTMMPAKFVERPQEWFVFGVEGELRFLTKNNPTFGEPVPDKKFIVVSHNATYQNPYGDPLLSKCFWPITFKHGGMKFWLYFAEKYGMPWAIGKQPRGTSNEDTNKLLSTLSNMIQDAVAVIPDDSSVDLKESASKGASADIYKGLKDCANEEISMAFLTQTLTTQVGDRGSYAAGKVHENMLAAEHLKDRNMIQEAFDTLIEWIYDLNFTSTDRATFSLYGQDDVDKAQADRDALLVEKVLTPSGRKLTLSYLQTTYGFKDEDLEDMPIPAPVITPKPGTDPNAIIPPADPNADPNNPNPTDPNNPIPPAPTFREFTDADYDNFNYLKKYLSLSGKPNAVKSIFGTAIVDFFQDLFSKTRKPKSFDSFGVPAFAEGSKTDPAAELISAIMNSIPEKLMQTQIEQTLKPVIKLINDSAEFSEVEKKLAELFPKMKTSQLEDLLTKVFFFAEIQGRLNPNQ